MDAITKEDYHVTWKADGTRYMLLLQKDGVYVVDRKFAVRRVQMRFPAVFKSHGMVVHDGTLLDGEMVVDEVAPGQGVLENKHSTDVESACCPPRFCMSIHTQGKSCSDIRRVIVLNDPPAGAASPAVPGIRHDGADGHEASWRLCGRARHKHAQNITGWHSNQEMSVGN